MQSWPTQSASDGAINQTMAGTSQARVWAGYAAYGCRVNAWPVEELFDRYAASRFLYPEKKQRLTPYLPEVLESWRRALRAGELIHWVASYEDPDAGGWATISSWRTSSQGWHTQHLVSTAGPVASRAVMLAGQSVRIADGSDVSQQNWFRRSNRFASSVFGTFTDTVSSEQAALIDYELLSVPLNLPVDPAAAQAAVPVTHGETAGRVADFVGRIRGAVFTAAEELQGPDIQLETVDALYRLVGLRRYRRIFLVEDAHGPLGVAVCYRGPLGFNFSFLENRCDLILRPGMDNDQAARVVRSLLAAVLPVYSDISIGYVPVVTDSATAATVVQHGGRQVRSYCQSIWLKSAFEAWYDHVDNLYAARLGTGRRR